MLVKGYEIEKGADLQGADLRYSDLRYADLQGTIIFPGWVIQKESK
jgi:uncharacterized protein YjbI with pentapeptide repeats